MTNRKPAGQPALERVAIADAIALLDSEAMRSALPGMSADTRLRILADAIWLRCGADFAVFRQEPMAGNVWRSVVFDLAGDRQFVASAISHMFDETDAQRLLLGSNDRDAADGLPAVRPYGVFHGGPMGLAFEVTRADWQRAQEQERAA